MNKVLLAIGLSVAVIGTVHAGPGYDDEVLKRNNAYGEQSTYGDEIVFGDDNTARIDLSRGQGSVEREPSKTEMASKKALSDIAAARNLLDEARLTKEKADRDYSNKMRAIEEERRLSKIEHDERMKLASAQSRAMIEQSHRSIEITESETVQTARIAMVDPILVRNERVNVDLQRSTIKEIATALMPEGWRVETDFSRMPELDNRRFMFTATDPRDQAMRGLVSSVSDVRVTYQYFFDLAVDGVPSPKLLISDRKIY